jgi:hypothetical protein
MLADLRANDPIARTALVRIIVLDLGKRRAKGQHLRGKVLAHPFGKLGRHGAAQDRRRLELNLAGILEDHRIEAECIVGAAAAPRLERRQRFGNRDPGRGEIDKALGGAGWYWRLARLRLLGLRRPRGRGNGISRVGAAALARDPGPQSSEKARLKMIKRMGCSVTKVGAVTRRSALRQN